MRSSRQLWSLVAKKVGFGKGLARREVLRKKVRPRLEVLEDRVTPAPLLVMEQASYQAGATALITGSGFDPSEQVILQVVRSDGSASGNSWTVNTGADGSLSTNWTVAAVDSAGYGFTVNAAGADGDSAQTKFAASPIPTQPTLTTDLWNYAPGATAVISGNGFAPGETVTLEVVHSDTGLPAAGTNPWTVTAGSDGSFTTNWYVNPVDSAGATLTVTATGATGDSASADFTDATELVNNSGFETGNFSGWSQAGNTGATGVSNSNVHSGSYSAQLGPVGSDGLLYQNLSTVAGTQYTFSWWLANAGGTPNDFSAYWNGSRIYSVTNLSAQAYQNISFTETATSSITQIEFAFRNDPSYLYLDDVSVQGLVGTTTSVSSSSSSSVYGQSVFFTASVGTTSPGSGGTPSGTMQFQINGSNFGSAVSTVNGVATSPSISTLSAGSYTITANFSDGSSYASSSGFMTQTVNRANPSLTVADAGGTYYGGAFPATGTVAGINGQFGSTLEGVGLIFYYYSYVSGNYSFVGNAAPSSAATYYVYSYFPGSADYNAASSPGVYFTINKATPTVTWSNPANITYGTSLSTAQLNATASVPGSFAYTVTATNGAANGTVLSPGRNQGLTATFTPADTTDYNTVTRSVLINVLTVFATGGYSFGAAEGTLSASQTVATFTDPSGAGALADYSASINWGDNSSSSAGTITVNNGTFTVQGSHAYAEEGTDAITVTISHDNAPNATATSSAAVTDAPLSNATSVAFSATEGAPFSGTVASFTDTDAGTAGDPTTNPADYSATITWGDGTTSPGTIAYTGTPGNFTVNASGAPHTYAEEGTQAGSFFVTIHHGTLADVSTPAVSVTVLDAALTATATPVTTAVEGNAFSGEVATFTDADPAGTLGDFPLANVTITWADGGTSNATTITQPGGVGTAFHVFGSHTYAEEGSYPVSVSIRDTGAATTFAAGLNAPDGLAFDSSGNLYVANYAGGTVSKVDIGGGVSVFASGFTHPEGLAFDSAGNLYVSHGDNAGKVSKVSPSGVVTLFADYPTGLYYPKGLAFDSGGNLYAADWPYGTVTRLTPGGTASNFDYGLGGYNAFGLAFDSGGNLYVANYASGTVSKVTTQGGVSTFAAGFSNPTGLAFDSSGNLYVASTNSDTVSKVTPAGVVSTFISSGLNQPEGLAFDASGNLYVANAGNNTVTRVVVTAVPTVTSTANVAEAALNNVANAAFSATEGAPFSGTVASFTDPAGETNPADYSATITWGDGTTSPGTIAYAGMAGNFTVNASGAPHAYAEEGTQAGSFFVTIHHGTLADVGTPSISVTVQDAVLTAGSLTPPSAAADQAFSNVPVFHFSDTDPNGTAGDYTAVVTLGDGNSVSLTSTATGNGQIVADAGGGFDVQLSYTYAHALSSRTFSVQVTDHSATVSASTNAFNVSPDATAATVSSSLNPSIYGQAVTFAAAVSNTTSGSSLVPTGSAQFFIDGVAYGSAVALDGTGHASITDSGLTVTASPHGITVSFTSSDGDFSNSNGSLAGGQTVTPATLTVTANPQTKIYGQADPTLTYVASGFQFTDTAATVLTGGLTRAPGEAVAGGPYAIGQGTLAADTNYTIEYTRNSLTITPAPLTVTADDLHKVYGATDATLTYTVSGPFYFGDDASVVSGVTLSTDTGAAATAGTHMITATGGTAANYTITDANGTLTVDKAAALTVTADNQSKVYGAADPTLSYTPSGTLYYGDSYSVISGVMLSTDTGAAATAGTHVITASGGTAANYDVVFVTGTLTASKAAALTVTANDQSKVYGADDPPLTYTPSGTLYYGDTDSVISGVALSTDTGAAATAGTHVITAAAGTAANYDVAFVTGTLTVAKAAALTVTADDQSKVYGAADPTLSYTPSGTLYYGDSYSVISGVTLSTDAGAAATAGTHVITSSGGTAANYEVGFVNGTLTVSKAAALTVTADDQSKTYGAAEPTLTYTVTGTTYYGDVAQAVVSGVSLSTTTGPDATAGTHAIFVTGGAADNYEVITANGTLTVAKAGPLTVTADNQSKVYGAADPTLSFTPSGTLYYGDIFAVITGVSLSTDTGAAATAGTHVITASGGTAANYDVVFVTGTLTVSRAAALTVTANNQSKVYGATDPTLTYTPSGTLYYGDTYSVITGVAFSTDTGAAATAGTHVITAAAGTAANYDVAFVTGTLTVAKAAALTVTADDQSKVYGAADPTLSYTPSGTLYYGDSYAVITGVTLSTDTGAAATAGTHVITSSGGTAANYEVAFVNGTLTVTPATLTVTAHPQTKVYGQADPALTYDASGFQYTDTATAVLMGALTRAAGETVASGPYAIGQGTLAADSNYTLSFTGSALTITPATLTVTANAQTKVYGQADPTLTYAASGLQFADTAGSVLTGALTRAPGETVAGGPYAISQGTLAADANYVIKYVAGTLTVSRDGSTTTLSATTLGQQVTFSATVSANSPGSGTPTGSVDFFDNTTNDDLGSVNLSGGVASLTATLPTGTQTITATYGGDADFLTGSATVSASPAASVYILNGTSSGALTVSGNGTISVSGVIEVDSKASSAVIASGNAVVSAAGIQVVGGVSSSGNAHFTPKPSTGAAAFTDPLAGLPVPLVSGPSQGAVSVSGNSSVTINPGLFASITVSGNGKLTMNAGIYIIAGGGFVVSGNGSVSGSGVLIYNAGSAYPSAGGSYGAISFSGNTTVSLSAASTGPYAGVLIFQARDNSRALAVSGNASASGGTIYAANAALVLTGNANLPHLATVVSTLSVSGGAFQLADGATSDYVSSTANQILFGVLTVAVQDDTGTGIDANEVSQISDAMTYLNDVLGSFGVSLSWAAPGTDADVHIHFASNTPYGGAGDGVLGFTTVTNDVYLVTTGWSFYTGADPSAIGAGQFDFLTLATHELAHTVGLGESSDPNSVMYEYLAPGTVRRTFTDSNLSLINTDADRFMKVALPAAHGSPMLPGQAVNQSVFSLGGAFLLDHGSPNPFAGRLFPASMNPQKDGHAVMTPGLDGDNSVLVDGAGNDLVIGGAGRNLMTGSFGFDQVGADRAATSADGPAALGEQEAWSGHGGVARTEQNGTAPFDAASSLMPDTADDGGALWSALTGRDADVFADGAEARAIDQFFGSPGLDLAEMLAGEDS